MRVQYYLTSVLISGMIRWPVACTLDGRPGQPAYQMFTHPDFAYAENADDLGGPKAPLNTADPLLQQTARLNAMIVQAARRQPRIDPETLPEGEIDR